MSKEKTLEKLNYNTLESKDGVIKIIHQEEETPKVWYDEPVKLSGAIQAPGNFIEKRKEKHNADKCHVIFSYLGLFIKLTTEENREIGYEVIGKLTPNPEIAALFINATKTFNVSELTKLIRMNKVHFADKDENLRMVSDLQKFKTSAQVEIEQANDNKGNVKDLYEMKSANNLTMHFDLLMPVFIGQEPKKFRVEIACAVRERNVDLWLESPELAELLKCNSKEIIDAQLARFPETFVFIEQ